MTEMRSAHTHASSDPVETQLLLGLVFCTREPPMVKQSKLHPDVSCRRQTSRTNRNPKTIRLMTSADARALSRLWYASPEFTWTIASRVSTAKHARNTTLHKALTVLIILFPREVQQAGTAGR